MKLTKITHPFGFERYSRNVELLDCVKDCCRLESYETRNRPIGSVRGYEKW